MPPACPGASASPRLCHIVSRRVYHCVSEVGVLLPGADGSASVGGGPFADPLRSGALRGRSPLGSRKSTQLEAHRINWSSVRAEDVATLLKGLRPMPADFQREYLLRLPLPL